MSADLEAERVPVLGPRLLWYHDPASEDAIIVNAYHSTGPILERVPALHVKVLAACDGRSTVGEIAETFRLSVADLKTMFGRLNHDAPGTVVWRDDVPVRNRRAQRLRAAIALHNQWRAAVEEAPDQVNYHGRIRNAVGQFETVEATVAHAFRTPHAALGMRTYSEVFCDVLLGRNAIPIGCRILEIGGGVGFFANGFLNRLKERAPSVYSTVTYTIADVAPALQASQREVCRLHADRMSFQLVDIESCDFQDGSFDLILANEMIADLRVAPVDVRRLRHGQPADEAEVLIARYPLNFDLAQPVFAVNIGAIRLIESISAWLRPGGLALLSEYGGIDRHPVIVDLGDHKEYSIHFGHLVTVARSLQLAPIVENLGEFLGADPQYPVVRRASLWLLRDYLMPELGLRPLPALTYDMAMLIEHLGSHADRIGNIRTQPLRRNGWMSPFTFLLLGLQAGPHTSPPNRIADAGSTLAARRAGR